MLPQRHLDGDAGESLRWRFRNLFFDFKTEKAAEQEAIELDRQMERDFTASFDTASKRHGRGQAYDGWCAELGKLELRR